MSLELRTRVLSGLRWSALSTAFATIATFALSVVLARLIDPWAFGVVGMMTFFRGLFSAVSAAPLEQSLVFHRHADSRDESAAFWIAMAVGLVLTTLMWLGAPWIVQFYGEPRLLAVVRIGALAHLLDGAVIVPRALLSRALRFADYSRVRMLGVAGNGIVAVAGALSGFGVWSIVVAELAHRAIELIAVCWLARWRPSVTYWSTKMPAILRYGAHLWGVSVIGYLGLYADRALIGRLLGANALAFYQRAFGTSNMASGPILSIAESVLLPSLTAVRDETARVRALCLRAVSITAVALMPLLGGLALVARPLVVVLYGEMWAAVGPMLEVLAWSVMVRVLGRPLMWLFQIRGETRKLFWWSSVAAVVYFAAVAIAASIGTLLDVCLAHLLASLVLFLPRCAFAGRMVGITLIDVLRSMAAPSLAVALMAAVLYGLRSALAPAPLALELVASICVGAVVYLAAIAALRAPGIFEIRDLVLKR